MWIQSIVLLLAKSLAPCGRCCVKSSRENLDGEPIIESGTSRELTEVDDGKDDDSVDESRAGSDDECSDTSSQARSEAKSNAKAQSRTGRMSLNRPVDMIADSIQAGFGSIERILTVRQAPGLGTRSGGDMNQLVAKFTLPIEAANASQAAFIEMQRDVDQSLRQSMENLQQMSASAVEIFAKMKEQICGVNL